MLYLFYHRNTARCILSPVDHPADVFIHGLRCAVRLLLRLSGRHEDIFQSETFLLEILDDYQLHVSTLSLRVLTPAVIHLLCGLFTRPLWLVCSRVIDLSEGHYTIWMCVCLPVCARVGFLFFPNVM